MHSAGYHTSAPGPQLSLSFTQFGTSDVGQNEAKAVCSVRLPQLEPVAG